MRTRLLFLVLIFWAHAFAQQPTTTDQQVYERFRGWVTLQPVDVHRSPEEVLQKYRAYLKTQAASDSDIDSEIRLIEGQGRRLEVERWNRILTSDHPAFNTKPNAFLVEMVKGRQPGKALDVGMGQGRNAIWLAQQGWDVTGFDPAERAVALAQTAEKLGVHLTTEIKGSEDFAFGENRWDVVVLGYVGARGLGDIVPRSLRPGGIVVVEAFHRDVTKGRSIGGAVVFDPGELPSLFKTLRVVRYQEPMEVADFGRERVRVVQFCAEKPVE